MARLYIFKNDKSIMKNLSKHEFEIYCLLFAADADFDITKQELIAIGSHTDPVTFVRIYNGFEADTDRERTTTLQECMTLYIKDELDTGLCSMVRPVCLMRSTRLKSRCPTAQKSRTLSNSSKTPSEGLYRKCNG